MSGCRTAAVRRSPLLRSSSLLQRSLALSFPDGIVSPLPIRGRISLSARRRAVCARVVIACPSWALTQCRLRHAQDRLQHALEVGDLLLQSLPPGGRQLVVASSAVIL